MPSLAHKDDLFETPPWVFDDIKRKTGLNFTLDACATLDNTLCEHYIPPEMDALSMDWITDGAIILNPPTSINGKFVKKMYEQWKQFDFDIVVLLRWNDLGNNYGKKYIAYELFSSRTNLVENYGKIKFYKNGVESPFPSRLTYFALWYKSSRSINNG